MELSLICIFVLICSVYYTSAESKLKCTPNDEEEATCSAYCPSVRNLRDELSSLEMVGAVSSQFANVVEDMLDARRCGTNRDRFWCWDGTGTEEEVEEDINNLPISSVCGRVRMTSAHRVNDRVDSEDPPGTWPWMASYGYWKEEDEEEEVGMDIRMTVEEEDEPSKKWIHRCGGTLVTHFHVVTAAHCHDGYNYWVRLGDTDLSGAYDDAFAVDIRAADVIIHPLHRSQPETSYYDVAVIRLEKEVKFTDFILPVCLPRVGVENPNHNAGKLVTLTGWGLRERNELAVAGGHLRRTHIGIFSQRYCNLTHTIHGESDFVRKLEKILPDLFQDNVMCAGYENDGIGSCVGDSGGPLVHFSPDFGMGRPRYVQLGVVSGGVSRCGDKDLPGIYPRMDHPDILDFVKKMASGAESVSFWAEWGEWSECSEKCDEGVRTRTRGCISSSDTEDGESIKCPDWGDKTETEPCVDQKCLITNVRAKTSSADTAGVDKFGAVSALFCTDTTPGARKGCCHTGRLDNPSKDDFEEGAIDDFWGFMIGQCENFHIPYGNIGSAYAVHMYIDGWIGEYFEVTFGDGAVVVRCGEANGRDTFEVDDDEKLGLKCWRTH